MSDRHKIKRNTELEATNTVDQTNILVLVSISVQPALIMPVRMIYTNIKWAELFPTIYFEQLNSCNQRLKGRFSNPALGIVLSPLGNNIF